MPISLERNSSPVLHAVLALSALLVVMVLPAYKPRGMTANGQRRQHLNLSRQQHTPVVS